MNENDLESLRHEFGALRREFQLRFEACEARLTKLEVTMAARPDKASVYQTSMAVSLSFIATAAVALLFLGTFFVS